MTGSARFLSFVVAVAMASATAVLATGDTASGGPPAPTDGAIEVARVPTPVREAALDYWTPERLAAAQPLDVTLGAESASTPTPQALNTYAKKVKKPYTGAMKAATGALFFTLPGSQSGWRCSGSAVEGETEIVVWSAGHCVYNAPDAFSCTDPPDPEPEGPCEPSHGAPGYVQSLVFIPGYKAGGGKTKPFGTFAADAMTAPVQWQTIGNFRYDYAAFTVDENGKGQLGGFVHERALNTGYALTPPLNFKAIGYPAVSPFNGNAQWRCPSEFLGQDISLGTQEEEAHVIGAPLPGEDPIRIMCDMTGGSSGGGWRLEGGVGSNVSYGYGSQPDRLFGPYLGAEAQALLNSLT